MLGPRCIAFGIGPGCESLIESAAVASPFQDGDRWIIDVAYTPGRLLDQNLDSAATSACPAHVASIAIPDTATPAEMELAFRLGHALRSQGTFVVITASVTNQRVLDELGIVADCIVLGGTGVESHLYPVRTLSDPEQGRLICYDLYDVLCIWAGRIGRHDAAWPEAEAWHLEISSSVGALAEVDRLAAALLEQVGATGMPRLVSVVDGLGSALAAATGFRHDSSIMQARVPAYLR